MEIEDIVGKITEEYEKSKVENSSAEGIEKLLQIAKTYEGEFRLISSEEIIEEVQSKPKTKMHYCGMPLIDDLLGGIRQKMLITVAAHSGHGKTAMGLFLTEKYKELNPVLIGLEQSADELVEQRLDNNQFIPHFYTNKTYAARVRPDWLEKRVIEGIAKFNSKLIVIDHLGYIDPPSKNDKDQEYLRIERKMQELKNIAKRWDVVIIVLVHIVQLDEGIPPSLASLKGSSAIKQESDKVILLWRKNSVSNKVRIYSDEVLFSLQKNRWSGKNGNVGLKFDNTTGHYKEYPKWVAEMEEIAKSEIKTNEEWEKF